MGRAASLSLHLFRDRPGIDGPDDGDLRSYRTPAWVHGGAAELRLSVADYVQDTDQKASEVGKGFLIGNAGVGRVPMPADFMAPAGYNLRSQLSPEVAELYKKPLKHDPLYGGVDAADWESVVASNRVVVGSPKTVIRKIKEGMELLRPGILESGATTARSATRIRCAACN